MKCLRETADSEAKSSTSLGQVHFLRLLKNCSLWSTTGFAVEPPESSFKFFSSKELWGTCSLPRASVFFSGCISAPVLKTSAFWDRNRRHNPCGEGKILGKDFLKFTFSRGSSCPLTHEACFLVAPEYLGASTGPHRRKHLTVFNKLLILLLILASVSWADLRRQLKTEDTMKLLLRKPACKESTKSSTCEVQGKP